MNRKRALKQLKELQKYGKDMRLAAEKWESPWQTLIAIILSARTRDEVTIDIASKLFHKYNYLKKLANAGLRKVEEIIRPINFYRNKSRNLVNCAKLLIDEYNGRPPLSFEKLVELPGVGRKTANVFLSESGKDAIGIDTHVSYISQKIGWTKNKQSKKIEKDLEELFPKNYWKSINPTLVRFGKTYTSIKNKNEILEKIKKIE